MEVLGHAAPPDPDRLDAAGWLLSRLLGQGARITEKAITAPNGLSDDDKALLAELREEVRHHLRRSDALPTCPRCAGRIIEERTFDGFANVTCPRCGRVFGCYPIAPEAIERFGRRGIEAIAAFRTRRATSTAPTTPAPTGTTP